MDQTNETCKILDLIEDVIDFFDYHSADLSDTEYEKRLAKLEEILDKYRK